MSRVHPGPVTDVDFSNVNNMQDTLATAQAQLSQHAKIANRVNNAVQKPLKEEEHISRGSKVGRWVKAFAAGTLGFLTCCLCCGCAGNVRGPGLMVKYDDEFDQLDTHEKKMAVVGDWCMATGLVAKCMPLCCGCCCGACGVIGPRQGVELVTSRK